MAKAMSNEGLSSNMWTQIAGDEDHPPIVLRARIDGGWLYLTESGRSKHGTYHSHATTFAEGAKWYQANYGPKLSGDPKLSDYDLEIKAREAYAVKPGKPDIYFGSSPVFVPDVVSPQVERVEPSSSPPSLRRRVASLLTKISNALRDG